jgi:hypothetical protein
MSHCSSQDFLLVNVVNASGSSCGGLLWMRADYRRAQHRGDGGDQGSASDDGSLAHLVFSCSGRAIAPEPWSSRTRSEKEDRASRSLWRSVSLSRKNGAVLRGTAQRNRPRRNRMVQHPQTVGGRGQMGTPKSWPKTASEIVRDTKRARGFPINE